MLTLGRKAGAGGLFIALLFTCFLIIYLISFFSVKLFIFSRNAEGPGRDYEGMCHIRSMSWASSLPAILYGTTKSPARTIWLCKTSPNLFTQDT